MHEIHPQLVVENHETREEIKEEAQESALSVLIGAGITLLAEKEQEPEHEATLEPEHEASLEVEHEPEHEAVLEVEHENEHEAAIEV